MSSTLPAQYAFSGLLGGNMCLPQRLTSNLQLSCRAGCCCAPDNTLVVGACQLCLDWDRGGGRCCAEACDGGTVVTNMSKQTCAERRQSVLQGEMLSIKFNAPPCHIHSHDWFQLPRGCLFFSGTTAPPHLYHACLPALPAWPHCTTCWAYHHTASCKPLLSSFSPLCCSLSSVFPDLAGLEGPQLP